MIVVEYICTIGHSFPNKGAYMSISVAVFYHGSSAMNNPLDNRIFMKLEL